MQLGAAVVGILVVPGYLYPEEQKGGVTKRLPLGAGEGGCF